MRLTRTSLRRAAQMVDYYAQFHPSVLSIQQFIDFGSKNACEKTSFTFLRKELPVRLANIMKEISIIPHELLSMPSVQLVESWYEQSLEEVLEFENTDPTDQVSLTRFCETLDTIRNRHSNVVETMAQGVIEMKEGCVEETQKLENSIQYFLNRFYMNRIAIRMLINQHVLLFSKKNIPHHRHVGSIDPCCDVLTVAHDAFDNAKFLCDQYYMAAPDCEFHCHNPNTEDGKIIMTYVPSHLYHMLFELFKNALRAVVELHGEDADLPKIQTMICRGEEDLTIKISDQGGGIPRNVLDLLFNYMYSTAPRPPSPAAASTTPLAGYGYGLPLSRLYAMYFNGDLRLSSVEGYGTDAMVYLKMFPEDASELLPIYNKTSSAQYTSSIPVGDWSDTSQSIGLQGGGAKMQTQHRLFSTSSRRRLSMYSAACQPITV